MILLSLFGICAAALGVAEAGSADIVNHLAKARTIAQGPGAKRAQTPRRDSGNGTCSSPFLNAKSKSESSVEWHVECLPAEWHAK
jgi:hypothetical protein